MLIWTQSIPHSYDKHIDWPSLGIKNKLWFRKNFCLSRVIIQKILQLFFPQYPVSAVGEKLQTSVQSKPIFRSVTVLDEELMPQSNIKMGWYISEAECSSQWDTICAILSRISVSCTTLTHPSQQSVSNATQKESLGKKIRLTREEHALMRLHPRPITLLQSFAALGGRIRDNAH